MAASGPRACRHAGTLGHQGTDDDGLGAGPAHEVERRRGGRTGGDDIVDDGHTTAPDHLDPGRVHPQHLGAVGGDGPYRFGQGLAQVDLGCLVEDHVVVQAEGSADLDGQRDTHGGHRHHDVGPEGCHQPAELPPGHLGEGHAVVHADEQGDGEVVGHGNEGELDGLGTHVDSVVVRAAHPHTLPARPRDRKRGGSAGAG